MEHDNTILPATNRDPITGAPGAHPVGVGLGAAAGGIALGAAAGAIAAGAAAGTLAAGPLGTVVGAAVGAIAGGLSGKEVAEHFDPTGEERYWRSNFDREPYYQPGMTYDDYAPAYRIGGEAHGRCGDASFEDVEDKLANDYRRARGGSRLEWDRAKDATRAAWARVKGQ